MRACIAIVLAIIVATTIQTSAAPASGEATPSALFTGHPYTSAMAALANYGSCGANASGARYRALSSELQALVSAAEAKGLGAMLERLRRDYLAHLAVSSMAACGGGSVVALANARRGLDTFQAWVADQPAHAGA